MLFIHLNIDFFPEKMITLRKSLLLLALVVVALADKPSPTYKAAPNDVKKVKEVKKEAKVDVAPLPAAKQTAQDRQDTYGAPAVDNYGAPAQDYSAPVAPAAYVAPEAPAAYVAPAAPVAYAAPAADTYGSPQAPAADTYGSPQAPAYTPPAQPSEGGTQGYYYYYYPVSTSPVQAQPQYAPPRQGFAGGNNPLASYGLPIGVAIVVGIAIVIGIGILVAAAYGSTTTTTTTGRSMLEYATNNIEDLTQYVYEGIRLWSQINSMH